MRIAIFGKQLDRYIFRQLLLALIAVTSGLTALIWLTQSLRFVELVVNHGLSFGVFLRLTALLIPSFVAVILPITTFVVVQFVYQRLAGDRELTVMRAAGLSPFALARPAIAVALLATVAGYGLNLWLVPASLSSFRQFQWEIRNRIAAFLVQDGVFTQVSEGLTVYVRSRSPDGTLHGILVDDERDKNAPATILAERGQLLEGPSGPRVLLINGSREEIDHQTGRLDILTFRENVVDLSDAAHQDSPRLLDMSEASIPNLLASAVQHLAGGPAALGRGSLQTPGQPADDTILCLRRPAVLADRHVPPTGRISSAPRRGCHRGRVARPRAGNRQSGGTRQHADPADVGAGGVARNRLRLAAAGAASAAVPTANGAA